MKAIYLEGGNLSLREVPAPSPGPGEALVKVELAGVCRTDIELARGYMGFKGIPGHEFAGTVVEADGGAPAGSRVVGEINLPCRVCDYCVAGLPRHCPNRTVLGIDGKDGAFAEFLTLPAENLHVIPESVSARAATFVEPLAACHEILQQVGLAGKSVAVLGDGKLGILAARLLAAEAKKPDGPKSVVLAGKHAGKLALAARTGVDAMLAADLAEECRGPFAKLDVVVEATGRAEGFQLARDCVRPRGVIVQKTTVAEGGAANLARIVVDEVTVVGSRCGPFEPAIESLASGEVAVLDLIEDVLPLSEGPSSLERAARPGALKTLVDATR